MKQGISVLAALVCLACAPAVAADVQLNTPRLSGMDNFRDIAGIDTAYSTTNNGVMRAGVFYRSNVLTPGASDLQTMEALKIKTVIDLRSPSEIAAQADTLPAGSQYHAVDIIGNNGAFVIDINKMTVSDVDAMMEQGERGFVTSDYSRQGFATVLNELSMADDAALFHCTAGKDRTGWLTAVLQSIAGVDRQDIMANYLATNDYTAERINATVAMLPPALGATYGALMGVRANWLAAGFDQVIASYGSMDNYLKQGLGLDQATIYVLRARMVRYLSLPGEAGLEGNAAAGAALLSGLQDSPLSGHYTAYNYYLQSAIDSSTLGGLVNRVGGQVYADAASYLLRQPSRLNDALAPLVSARGIAAGETRVWLQGLSGYLGSDEHDGNSAVSEHTSGVMVGATTRLSQTLALNGGIGYGHGSVGSAGGKVKTNTTTLQLGGRYGFYSLEQGPWAGVQGNAGYIDYQSDRRLGYGLGNASGDSHGQYYSGRASLGWLAGAGSLTLDPALGVQVTHLKINGFKESGSELALVMDGINTTQTSLVADMGIHIAPQKAGNWTLNPGISLGYERLLNDARVTQRGTLYGISIDQGSAFNSKDVYKAGVQLSGNWRNVTLGGQVSYLTAGSHSDGVSGMLNAQVSF
ncbi:tyrosine-protein phosphatase [Entomohabitans teleogrylli]|uniref:tyrosine-protein phosphatase n=1 Tax=Entomohabitans teleogrylli TaxID=1384589 RepID=UPI00073D71CB|nr:tyrosine-protein phosphatase [Entomohabitans teleogrylli]